MVITRAYKHTLQVRARVAGVRRHRRESLSPSRTIARNLLVSLTDMVTVAMAGKVCHSEDTTRCPCLCPPPSLLGSLVFWITAMAGKVPSRCARTRFAAHDSVDAKSLGAAALPSSDSLPPHPLSSCSSQVFAPLAIVGYKGVSNAWLSPPKGWNNTDLCH